MLAVFRYLRRITYVLSLVMLLTCGLSFFGSLTSHASSALVLLVLPFFVLGAAFLNRTLLKMHVYATSFFLILQGALFWITERLKCTCNGPKDLFSDLPLACPTGEYQSLLYSSVVVFLQFCLEFFCILVSAQLKAKIENEAHVD
eukprot:ANDGO_05397.mRNA.1 hypothetical protein